MNKISLQDLDLVIFNKDNTEHIKFLKQLIHDKSILERFQGITNGLLHNHGDSFFDRGFFVSYQDMLIGYVKIGEFNDREKCVTLRYAIISTERGRGYGKLLLSEITNYIFANYDKVESIRLKIANDNKASLGAANACGFKWIRDDFYGIYNPDFINNKF